MIGKRKVPSGNGAGRIVFPAESTGTRRRENGFSRRAFYRNWKKYMLMTPARYVLQLRLEESCRLLKGSRLGLREIAAHLPFVHAEYFCHVFRKEFGMTPLQYREQGPRRMENGSG